MALHRSFDGQGPVDPEPVGGAAGWNEERRDARSSHLAAGTLACPACDAPVAPGPRPLTPGDALACPVCLHAGAVRDFLSLAAPTRPAHVQVRVVQRTALLRRR